MFVYMPMCVRAFALREYLHSKAFLAVSVEVTQQKWWDRIGKMSCQIMAEMGGGEGLPGASASYPELAEIGGRVGAAGS